MGRSQGKGRTIGGEGRSRRIRQEERKKVGEEERGGGDKRTRGQEVGRRRRGDW